jgi:hypothetical protein
MTDRASMPPSEPIDPSQRLRQAWELGKPPANLDAFLPPPDHPERASVLRALVLLDMELSAQFGGGLRTLAWYEARYPELRQGALLALGLIQAELRLRLRLGEPIQPEELAERFPEQFDQLLEWLTNYFAAQDQQATRSAQRLASRPSTEPVAPPPSRPSTEPVPLPQTDSPTPGGRPGLAGSDVPTSHSTPPRRPSRDTSPFSQPPEDVVIAPGQVVYGYRLIRVLGQGGFGRVWLAEAPGGFQVAVKTVEAPRSHKVSQVESQALEIMKRLSHDRLAPIHAAFATDKLLFIAMGLADGGTLADLIRGNDALGYPGGPLQAKRLLPLMRESAEGLDYLHARNYVHRDIKPANILLFSGHAKVADFGLIKVVQDHRLQDATFAGSLLYMAPEIWQGRICPASDQYALAMTYLEARLGETPIRSRNNVEIMAAHLERHYRTDPLPEAERRVVERALAVNPADRFASCLAFVEALEQAVHAGIAPPDTPLNRQASPRGQRRLVPVLVGLLAVLGLTGGLAVWWLAGRGSAVVQTPLPTTEPEPTPKPAVKVAVPDAVVLPAVTNARLDYAESELIERGEKKYPRRLTVTPNAGGEPLLFVLVPQWDSGQAETGTFWMMQDNLTHAAFVAYANAQPKRVEFDEWKKGGLGLDRGQAPHPKHPVFGVRASDAHRYAAYLNARLPSFEQWRKAAGFYALTQPDPLAGLTRPQVAVGLTNGPMPVGEALADRSIPYRLHDMRGNGYQWTRTVLDYQSEVGSPNLPADAGVVLCGQDYAADSPLRLESLTLEGLTPPPTAPLVPSRQEHFIQLRTITFRLVLEPARPQQ